MRILVFENAALGPDPGVCDGCGDVIEKTEGFGSASLTGDMQDAYGFCKACWRDAKCMIRRLDRMRLKASAREDAAWSEFLCGLRGKHESRQGAG